MYSPRPLGQFRPTVSLTPILFGLLTLLPAAFALAQQNVAEQDPARVGSPEQTIQLPPLKMKPALNEFLSYDPAERGPLIIVLDPAATFKPDPRLPRLSLTTAARIFARKVVNVGGALSLVPLEMTVVETTPGRPNLYEGLENAEKVQLLFGSLTEAQWQALGSEQGLGVGDLSSDQRPLFLSLLPPKVTVNTFKGEAVEGRPNTLRHVPTGAPPFTADPSAVRLRAMRGMSLVLKLAGTGNSYIQSDTENQRLPGEIFHSLDYTPSRSDEEKQTMAFGVRLLKKLPSKQKFSHLAYDAPALNAPVVLTPEMETVGDALKAAGAAAKLELIADARVRDLPLYFRGNAIRTGDLLGAIAWGVTGTFRRLGERTFFLTDDVEGMAPRYLKLREWEQAAQTERGELINKLLKKAASLRPVRFLSFRADDPASPPPEISAKMEHGLRKPEYQRDEADMLHTADLPPALQAQIRKKAELMQAGNYTAQTDKVQLLLKLQVALVVPGVGLVKDSTLTSPAYDGLLRRLVPDEDQAKDQDEEQEILPSVPKPAATASPPDPVAPVFPPDLKRRIALIALPAEKEAAGVFQKARERGFTEVWLRATLENPDATARRIAAAAAAGKAEKMGVGVVLSLLKYNSSGDDERNILGETSFNGEMTAGWKTFENPETLARQVRTTLIPLTHLGLSAVVISHSAAPGYTGETQQGSFIAQQAQTGYTLPRRVTFVRKEGYDPLDLPPDKYGWGVRVRGELPFFSNRVFQTRWINDDQQGIMREDPAFRSPTQQWFRFRADHNLALLQPIHRVVKGLMGPSTPVYFSDRLSDFSIPNGSWYGTWDKAETLPQNAPFSEDATTLKLAKAASKNILLTFKLPPLNNAYSPTVAGSLYVRRITSLAGQAAKSWNGMVVDLSTLSPEETLEMLSALPQ